MERGEARGGREGGTEGERRERVCVREKERGRGRTIERYGETEV